jgi:hypothetical protein
MLQTGSLFTCVLKNGPEPDLQVEREDEEDFRIPGPAGRSAALFPGEQKQKGKPGKG